MPNYIKRYYGQGDLHFVTFSCYRRAPRLGHCHARNIFVEVLGELRTRHHFSLVGYVVMPEHVHLLISETPNCTPSLVSQVLKQNVARELKCARQQKFWETRFYDFNVHSAFKLREKLNYMHLNPVKRGLVSHPAGWPWSSFLNYEGKPGLLPIDFV